jgi:hypothetical protein
VRLLAAVLVALGVTSPALAGTVPSPVADAVHGRVMGWDQSGSQWAVVYVNRPGGGRCGLAGASWRLALVETAGLPARVVADVALGGAMCGNELAWVRTGRFSDGRHREVAFTLWTTPSIGARTMIFRLRAERLQRLAVIPGDRVALGRGIATVIWENRGRSPRGEITDTYRFDGRTYQLVARA